MVHRLARQPLNEQTTMKITENASRIFLHNYAGWGLKMAKKRHGPFRFFRREYWAAWILRIKTR